MANFSTKCSIMTQEIIDSFCESFYIPAEVHPTAPGRDKTIAQFPASKVGVYTRIFNVYGYRIPFTNFFMAVLKYFRVHISQLLPFGAARVSHFEVLTRVLDLSPSVTVFRAFYTRTYSDGLFSFAKRSTSAPSCFPKPPDSIKNWADHFFWVDSCIFPISVPLYTGGVLEKDSAPHLTARQEQTVKLLENHKAPFRWYPECFLCLVGLSLYYPFDENSYLAFECPGGMDMGLLDFIKTADPRKVRAVEVQKGDDQEDVAEENAYLELADPDEGTAMVRQSEEEVVTERPKKIKKKRPTKQSDVLPAKKLRTNHPSLASGTGGKTLAGLEQIMPAGSRLLAREYSSTLSAPVDTAAATTTSTKAKLAADVNPDLAGPSQLEESEGSDDSFFELATFDPSEEKRWYVPRWNITNDSLLDDGFSCRTLVDRVAPPAFFASLRSMDYDQLYTEFNVGAAQQICLGSELLEEKDSEILRLKSQLAEKEAEVAEVIRLRDQVSSLSGEKSTLIAEVSALKVTITQKDNDIFLLDSRATHLASSLDDAKVACSEAGTKISSLAFERDRLASEVSSLRAGFQDFKEKMEVQQENQAQELYNRMAELEVHMMDVFGRLEGEFYPTYLTLLVGRRWLLTHGIQLALFKYLKSSEYQGILGHALGRAVDFRLQEGLEAGHEHGVAGRSLSVVDAYNPEVTSADYVNAVKALEDAHFPLVDLLKSKKDAGMDEVLDCFLLDGPLAELPEAASLQPCIEQLSIPIHHAGDKTAVGETSLSFALMNVHARAEGAKKHAAALRQLMMEIVSAPLSSQTWVGEASISAAPLSVEDYAEEDTDEALGSVVAVDAEYQGILSHALGRAVDFGMQEGLEADHEHGVAGRSLFIVDPFTLRCAHRTCESSPIQSLLLSSNRALITSPILLFALSTKPFACGCFTKAKHWWIHSFSHQYLNGLSWNCFSLSDIISLATIKNLTLPGPSGKGSAMSIPSLYNGHKDVMRVKFCCGFLGMGRWTWQSLHSLISFLASVCILGHALGRAVDFGMQEGLEAGHEHGVAGRSLFVVDAYNPEVASADYVNAVKALEDAHFPLVDLLKSKKDAGMDEVLDCFLLDGPLTELPEAASL
ncbi:hypothetical protein Tco_0169387 [Tanacetum coccineum]